MVKTVWTVIVVATALLVLAACGNGSAKVTTSQLSQIAQTTASAGSAKVEEEATAPGQPPEIEKGVYDFQRHLGEILPTASLLGGGTYEAILDGSTAYVQLPPPVPEGKKWLAVPQPNGPSASLLSLYLGPSDPADPDASSLLGGLASVIGPVQRVGTQAVDGVSTTEYRFVVEPDKVTAKMTKATAQQKVEIDQSFGPAHPVLIWVDDQGRLRRIQVQLVFPNVATMTSTVTYSDFGVAVSVRPPPSNQVVTLHQLEKLCPASGPNGVSGSSNSIPGSQCGIFGGPLTAPKSLASP